ncbi:MAG: ATP-binding protein [Chloroflexi bacterium]|uniref:ATP-binding protein n=1 Tax=Candidatus Chlorohelix allophototropha TaxID=3003348 RepID=A0A8T7M0E4_9CHLR|nr:ATP-binding protein [Chloroflexota bacterium]WJW66704.1 sensor histidine kinase [Chloroflexota bacterium L227-S17]
MSMSPLGSNPDPEEIDQKLDELMIEARNRAEELNKRLSEVEMLIRQNQTEVDRLGAREGQLSARLKDMETNMDAYSLPDIKVLYNSYHEVQLRLNSMRKEVELLRERQKYLKEQQQENFKLYQILNQRPKSQAVQTSSHVRGVQGVEAQEMVGKIIQAQENERLRVSRQLHDGPAQAMSNLVLRAEICERWMEADIARAKAEITGLKSMVNDTLQETRGFIFQLRPMILDDLGLLPTLRRYIKDFQEKNKIEVNLVSSGVERRLPNQFEVAVFRIIQEALSNVAIHAHALHVNISLDLGEQAVTLSVEDDGNGFDIRKLEGEKQQKSLGIHSMGQRTEMLNGRLEIASTPGRGTRVAAYIPLVTV